MNHSFNPSNLDNTKCMNCGFTEVFHTDKAECECCEYIGPLELMKKETKQGSIRIFALCPNCAQNERTIAANKLQAIIDSRKQIDESVEVRTDFFNLESVSISELKNAINSSDTPNKPYMLAEQLMARYNHFKQVIFGLQEQLIEANNRQRAVQTELNQMANQLRQEEREKLRIQDINYKPQSPKKVNEETKTRKPSTKKLDKMAIRKAAEESGLPEYMIQMVVTSNNISIEDAVKKLKGSLGMN